MVAARADCHQVKKDFSCRLDLLLRHMKYFESYLVDAPTTSDIDISVRTQQLCGDDRATVGVVWKPL